MVKRGNSLVRQYEWVGEMAASSLEEVMHRLEKRFEARRRQIPLRSHRKHGRGTGASGPVDRPAGESPCVDASLSESDCGVCPSLFSSHNHQRRAYFDGVPVYLEGVGKISYRGQELRADDQAVWRQILERVRREPRSAWLEFTPRSLLRAMGWGMTRHERARIRICLERMQATVLGIPNRSTKTEVRISLIDKCEWRCPKGGKAGHWRVWIEPELSKLFPGSPCPGPENSKGVDRLAMRLRGVFGNHLQPYPRRVETLWRQCDGEVRTEGAFRNRLKAALEKLKHDEFLEHYEISANDLVQVTRVQPPPSSGHGRIDKR